MLLELWSEFYTVISSACLLALLQKHVGLQDKYHENMIISIGKNF